MQMLMHKDNKKTMRKSVFHYVKPINQLSSKTNFQKMDQHTGGKWLKHGIKHCKGSPLRWRQNGRDSVSNHQPRHGLLSLLFGRRSRKTSKLRVTGLCVGNSPGPVNSPHKGPVTRKMFPFDDVIMQLQSLELPCRISQLRI